MMSESFFTPGRCSVLARPRTLRIFRVKDHVAQQRVLRALRRLGRADLAAIAAERGDESFVIIDWDVAAGDLPAQQLVTVADRDAAMTFRSRETGASLV
jgi:hypothetical protein